MSVRTCGFDSRPGHNPINPFRVLFAYIPSCFFAPMKSALTLKQGERRTILKMTDEKLTGRFLELGISPGCEIELVRYTPLKRTYYIRVENNVFALRNSELESIILQE